MSIQILLIIIIFLISLFILFIYFCLCWVFVAAHGPSPAAASGDHSLPRCVGLSPQWPPLLRSTGSRCAGFSNCSTQAQQLQLMGSRAQAQQPWCTGPAARGMWDPPGPGLEPATPALAGGPSTTAPPGKPSWLFFNQIVSLLLNYMSYLYILDVNLLSDIWFADIFSHSLGCLFILLIISFAVYKLFRLR